MKHYTRSEIVSGMFVMLAMLVFAFFAFKVGDIEVLRSLKGPALTCVADFRDVKSLKSGAPVMVAGLKVGEVTDTRIAQRLEDGLRRQIIEVRFDLYDADLRLDPETAQVQLGQTGLLGQYFLSLDPGFWAEERAPAMQEFDEPISLHSAEAPSMEAMFVRLSSTLDRADHILQVVDEQVLDPENVERLAKLIEDSGVTMSEIRRTLSREDPEGLHQMILRPLQLLISSADEDLAAMQARTDSLLEKSTKLVDELSATSKQLAVNLETAQDALVLMRGMLQENRPEVAETMRRLRRTTWEMEMAMRKIRSNPAFLLFGDEEPLYDVSPQDSSATLRSGRARPYEQRDEVDDGR